jgi:Family of unknown function (DUF5343)
MTVPSAYLTSARNTAAILEAIQRAQVPERFTFEFLKQLGFSSSSDRPTIGVLKAIGFLDDSSVPTTLYRQYKDKSIARAVLAQGVRAGYADVFAVDTEAHTRTIQQVNGVFARLSDKGESVTSKMAMTFKSLVGLADFGAQPVLMVRSEAEQSVTDLSDLTQPTPPELAADGVAGSVNTVGVITLRHDIHVHLPLSTDVAVYDAIFKSLRANLQ